LGGPVKRVKRCGQCGAEGVIGEDDTIRRCKVCEAVYYCVTGPCQRLAWREGHKQQCPLLREARRQAHAGRVPSGAAPPSTS
jgi:NADH pyrophosphatase NudC (nudix superfamily)